MLRESTGGDAALRAQTMQRAKVELEAGGPWVEEPLRRLAAQLAVDPAARIRPVAAKKAPEGMATTPRWRWR
ncbi:MAG: hypothetical protein IPK72_22510 [Candidatus Eisenbacteria bacterium]|nr:hypothetical protein [Candidatus Eisenbacteria bacterium]